MMHQELEEQLLLRKWKRGFHYVGTTIDVSFSEWLKISDRSEWNSFGKYAALKEDVVDFMESRLVRITERKYSDPTITCFHFFHAEDAVQFKLRFL